MPESHEGERQNDGINDQIYYVGGVGSYNTHIL